MSVLTLGSGEIAIAGGLISCSAGLSLALHMGIGRRLAWAALRMSLQLLAVGYLLRLLFRSENGLLVGLVMVVMLARLPMRSARASLGRGAGRNSCATC